MIEDLLNRQNVDGGWGYRKGGTSWTEPTCLSILALLAGGVLPADASVRRAAAWIAQRQNADGGWSPQTKVAESTWVTAMVLLLPDLRPSDGVTPLNANLAESWLYSQTGRESGFWHQLRLRLMGSEVDPGQAFDGWPWYPGAAAWVAPTAISILALEMLQKRRQEKSGVGRQNEFGQRLRDGRAYLLARRCRDGGWNHGSTRALGYDSDSYPETTGMALLALHGVGADADRASLGEGLDAARRHLQASGSLEATSWLTLALLAHGETPAAPQVEAHGGTNELALAVIATEAVRGRNIFVA